MSPGRLLLALAIAAVLAAALALWLREPEPAALGSPQPAPGANAERRPPPAAAEAATDLGAAIAGTVLLDEEPAPGASVYLHAGALETQGPSPCPSARGKALLETHCLAAALEAARRLAEGELAGEALDFAAADAAGAFRFPAQPGRVYGLWAEHGDWTALCAETYAGQRVTLRLVQRPPISGVVEDELRRPVPGAQVSAIAQWPLSAAGVTADAQGRFLFERPAGGAIVLLARAPGYLPALERARWRDPTRLVVVRSRAVAGVVKREGRPVPGATVTLGDTGLTARTGADGRFAFAAAGCQRRCALVAEQDGWFATHKLDDEEGEVPLQLDPGAHLTLRLRAASARAVSGAKVTLRLRVGPPAALEQRAPDLFVGERLPPGTFHLSARAPGFAPASLITLVLGPGERAERELVLEDGVSIEGRVVDSAGRPVGDALVRVIPGEGERSASAEDLLRAALGLRFARTDAAGAFAFRDLERGGHRLRAEKDGFGSVEQAAQAPSPEVVLTLGSAGGVRGRVTAGGAPVAGARIAFSGAGDEAYARSAGDGSYHRGGLAPGSYELVAEREGLLPARRSFATGAGETAVVDVELEPGLFLEGQVVGPAGEPVDGAQVIARVERRFLRATSDARGRFSFGGLAPGAVALSAEAPGWMDAERTAPAGAKDVRLVLPGRAGLVRGRVVGPDGAPLQRFRVQEREYQGPEGTFAYPMDRAGPHRLRLQGAFPEASIRVDVAPGQTVDLGDVRVEQAGKLTGLVRAPGGGKPSLCRAWLDPSGRASRAEATVDIDGGFQVTAPLRRAVVRAHCREGFAAAEVDPSAGAARVELTLQPGGELRVRLPQPAGRGLVLAIQGPWMLHGEADAGGVASISGVPPGSYHVTYARADLWAHATAEVAVGGVAEVSLDEAPPER